MNFNDIYSLFTFSMIWIQPIFWMFFFYNKTKKLNTFGIVAMPTLSAFLIIVYLLQFVQTDIANFYHTFPMFSLYTIYIICGFSFATYLMFCRKWELPQALSISTLITFIGGFYWQSPYLISNAFILGFQLDWVLHLTGLMFVWFIASTTGWKKDRNTIIMVLTGFVITTLFILGWYVPPSQTMSAGHDVWNSPYYMADRLICTTIAFLAIKKDAPVWRKKNVDNIKNTA